MMLKATFNNIVAISWRSVLLVEETEYPEKTIDLPQGTDKHYHIMLYRVLQFNYISLMYSIKRWLMPSNLSFLL